MWAFLFRNIALRHGGRCASRRGRAVSHAGPPLLALAALAGGCWLQCSEKQPCCIDSGVLTLLRYFAFPPPVFFLAITRARLLPEKERRERPRSGDPATAGPLWPCKGQVSAWYRDQAFVWIDA